MPSKPWDTTANRPITLCVKQFSDKSPEEKKGRTFAAILNLHHTDGQETPLMGRFKHCLFPVWLPPRMNTASTSNPRIWKERRLARPCSRLSPQPSPPPSASRSANSFKKWDFRRNREKNLFLRPHSCIKSWNWPIKPEETPPNRTVRIPRHWMRYGCWPEMNNYWPFTISVRI